MGLRPLACWDCVFESRQGYGGQSLVGIVRCPVDFSATGHSLVQRSPTECVCVCVCVCLSVSVSLGVFNNTNPLHEQRICRNRLE